MESVSMDNGSSDGNEKQDGKGTSSETTKPTATAENFQRYMYDLFEKNGVMNDLRSYLRGHIVNVLRSAHSGATPPCQKHFTQRLELAFQAINILIAEYLMCLKFSYSLSVFISEIPLANMVFSFAKTLMEEDGESTHRFKDSDIWCILNYLGLKCDSEHAKNVLELYKSEQSTPLLICILKTSSLHMKVEIEETQSSVEDSASTGRTSETLEDKPQRKPSMQEKCHHYVFCKACQSKVSRIREKYKRKKKDLAKGLMKDSSISSHSIDDLMKNISVMEKNLIDEMFEQLRSVYETEMTMMKEEEEKRVKKSLASHSSLLQKKRDEMEVSFKAREQELQDSVDQKKRFLWGLAQTLRAQHCHMTRAMQDVRQETQRLAVKEDSLKTQLVEAEEILRKRGEEMRHQISEELAVLEGHLEDMKKERDSINRERAQLEQYKNKSEESVKEAQLEQNKSEESVKENEDLNPHYDLLKNEFAILKKYLESAKLSPKCVIERSTLTDLNGVTSRIDVLNNEQEVKCEDRPRPKQVVNDLKKPKNVNFSTSFDAEGRSRSSASSSAGDAQCDERDALATLQRENEQLRSIARQQRSRIDSLAHQADLPRAATSPAQRPRTAPPAILLPSPAQRMNSASVNNLSYGWRKGAGEELGFLGNAMPRIVVPGESIPFVGVVSPHTDNRRYLLNQWRSLRRRISPRRGDSPVSISKSRPTSPLPRNIKEKIDSPGPSRMDHGANQFEETEEQKYQEEYHNQYQEESKDNQVISEQENFRPAEYQTGPEQYQPEEEPEQYQKRPEQYQKRPEQYQKRPEQYEKGPEQYPTRPEQYQSRPEQNQTRPGEYQMRPEQYQPEAEPEQYQKRNEQYEKGPEQYQTRPEKYQPISNQQQNQSDQYQDLAEEYQTRPDQYQKRADECQAGPRQYQTGPGAYQTRPEQYQFRQNRELSPQTTLREAKEKLKWYKDTRSYPIRDKSPNCVLRDAKRRLRKLEIEAEAVEKSYLEFRRKQEERKQNEVDTSLLTNKGNTDSPKCSNSLTYCVHSPTRGVPLNAYEKYFKEYQNCTADHFKNNNAAVFRISPIPNGFSTEESAPMHHENYVEQPLIEFRKYYNNERNSSNSLEDSTKSNNNKIKGIRHEIVRKAKNDQKQQLELLKQNIGKIYNMPVQAIDETLPEATINSNNWQDVNIKPRLSDNSNENIQDQSMPRNLLKIEVQSISEINNVKVTDSQSQDVMLIVESSAKHIDNGDNDASEVRATTEMCIIVSPKLSFSKNTEVISPRRNEAISERIDMITTKINSRSGSPVKLPSRIGSIISKGSKKSSIPSSKSPIARKDVQDSVQSHSETHTRNSDQTRKSVSVKSKMTTDDVVAIFHDDTDDQLSSEIIKANGSKISNTISLMEENEDLDYPDDFSADVDNYNMRSNFGDQTPVPKTSEDENFWDS